MSAMPLALSEWLYGALVESKLETVCIETRHTQRFLSSRPNKTDRSDASGQASMPISLIFLRQGASAFNNGTGSLRALPSQTNFPFAFDDADRCGVQRHIQSDEQRHRAPPSLLGRIKPSHEDNGAGGWARITPAGANLSRLEHLLRRLLAF